MLTATTYVSRLEDIQTPDHAAYAKIRPADRVYDKPHDLDNAISSGDVTPPTDGIEVLEEPCIPHKVVASCSPQNAAECQTERLQGVTMPREIAGKGLRFSLRHAPCAHICRYCLISESRKRSALPFARFEALVHRFHDWRQAERPDLDIGVFVGPSYDYDIETLKGMARLRERRGAKFRILNLGGLRMRRGDELTAWLHERRAAGIVGFHASLAGCSETHDRWNGRRGDFDYQLEILRLGGSCGMVREEKLFLTKNTLPLFDRLLEILDAIPGEVRRRTASPFFYAGLAMRYENERLTEDDRDRLPQRINELRPNKFDTWLSEREWIPVMLETASTPRRLSLKLDVDETNIDYLELASCEEIFVTREREYQQSYQAVPPLDELCSRYGDPTNRRIYIMSRDVEGRWLDLHQRETGASKPID